MDDSGTWHEGFPRSWRDVVLAVALLATFVALCFSPAATCSVKISDSSTPTTTADLGRV